MFTVNGTSNFTGILTADAGIVTDGVTVINNGGTIDSTVLTDGGTIGFDWVDAEVADTLSIIGGIIGYFLPSESIAMFFLPFAAGGFIYIAASDLIPELKKEVELKRYISHFIIFIIGVLAMYGLLFID